MFGGFLSFVICLNISLPFIQLLLLEQVASSRRSVSQGAVEKTAREKLTKSATRGGERTPVGKLNKRSFRYTRIWYTLWLVSFDRFCQHSSITDADGIYDMAAVRDLSTSNDSNAVFKSIINNKLDYSMVACLAVEAILNERPSWTYEHNRSRSNGNAYRLRSREEPESVRLCVKMGKQGSWHPYIYRSVFGISTFCFAEFDTSVIYHSVFLLCLGSFLLQNMSLNVSIQ